MESKYLGTTSLDTDQTMMDCTTKVSVVSFNMTGGLRKSPISLCDAFDQFSIIFFQETWLHDSVREPFTEIARTHVIFSKQGYDDDKPLVGRPYGGLATAVRSSVPCDVVDTESRKFLPILVHLSDRDILTLNVYLPCNSGIDSTAQFSDVLAEMSAVIDDFPDTPILIGGDINCDPRESSLRARLFRDFCDEHRLSLLPLARDSPLSFSYSKWVEGQLHKSLIDWFCASSALHNNNTVMRIHSAPDLISDHSPVDVTLAVALTAHGVSPGVSSTQSSRASAPTEHPVSKREIDQLKHENWLYFQCVSDSLLNTLCPPHDALVCEGKCSNSRHESRLNDYLSAIKQQLSDSLIETLLHKGVRRTPPSGILRSSRKPIPGWKTHVLPLQRTMIELHQIWRNEGSIAGSEAHRKYSEARRLYHQAHRRVVANSEHHRSAIIANKLSLCSGPREFWKTLSRSFPPAKPQSPPSIGGIPCSSPEAICDKWATSFGHDFSQYDCNSDRIELEAMLRASVSRAPSRSECWSQTNVERALYGLSSGKCPGPDGIIPEVLKFAPISLSMHLSLLFRACEAHGFLPASLSEALIHPVPKQGKDRSSAESYRPITIGSTLAKVFESCILAAYGGLMSTSDLQFGFKAGLGTAQCTLAVKSVARHFTSRGSRVYATLLDASKAFDRANFARIFRSLLLRGVPPSVVQLLYKWYLHTKIRVTWNKAVSSTTFSIEHGVRQGGLLSPSLFAILYDELLLSLQNSGLGCHIGSKFVGAFAYADDIILLAPSITALNGMLKICHQWSTRSSIAFNPSKSVAICLRGTLKDLQKDIPIKAYLGDSLIATASQVTHLGHILSADLTDSAELARIAKAYNRQYHMFANKFRPLKDRTILLDLYKTYCTSFYGIESIFPSQCSSTAIKLMKKAVNLTLMRLLQLPRESVSPHLLAHGVMNAETLWRYRLLSYWSSPELSKSPFGRLTLDTHRDYVTRVAQTIKLPFPMPGISRSKIHDHCISAWASEKGLL